MRIGQLAQVTGVTIPTLRFYERCGLLLPPLRTEAGYRVYPAEVVQRVRFIKGAQELGFSLQEIAELLLLREHRPSNGEEARSLTRTKIQQIDEKMRSLRRMRSELQKILAECTCDATTPHCPILETLVVLEPQGGAYAD